MLKIIFTIFSVSFISVAYAHDDYSEGKRLYRVYCTQCHGVESDGYGINVADMEVLPKDHTDRESMQTRTDKDLFKAIKYGGKSIDKSVLMPNWDGNFSDEQINQLVKFLRVVCCKKTDE